jgi:hypothetical protein
MSPHCCLASDLRGSNPGLIREQQLAPVSTGIGNLVDAASSLKFEIAAIFLGGIALDRPCPDSWAPLPDASGCMVMHYTTRATLLRMQQKFISIVISASSLNGYVDAYTAHEQFEGECHYLRHPCLHHAITR